MSKARNCTLCSLICSYMAQTAGWKHLDLPHIPLSPEQATPFPLGKLSSTAVTISGRIDLSLSPFLSFPDQSHFVKHTTVKSVVFFLLIWDDSQGCSFFLPIPLQASFPRLFHTAFAQDQPHVLPKAVEPNISLTLFFLPVWIPGSFFLPLYIPCIPKLSHWIWLQFRYVSSLPDIRSLLEATGYPDDTLDRANSV